MRFDCGTLDSGEQSLPFGLLVLYNILGMKVHKYHHTLKDFQQWQAFSEFDFDNVCVCM